MYPVIRSWEDNHRFDRLGNLAFHIGTYLLQPVQAHRHEFLELSLVIEGEGCQIVNSREYLMKPGTFTFLLPYQVYEVPASSQPMRLFTCIFDLGFLFRASVIEPGLKDMLLQEELSPSIQLKNEPFAEVSAILQNMIQEYHAEELWRDGLLQIKLVDLLIRFERLRRQENFHWCAAVAADRNNLWSVIHYMHTHYGEPISLAGMSEMFEIGRSYLSTQFKKYTGKNFIGFLHEIRIRHACSLLLSSRMSGIDIAAEVGFSSFKSFARIFRELKGQTPGEFRSRNFHRDRARPNSFP